MDNFPENNDKNNIPEAQSEPAEIKEATTPETENAPSENVSEAPSENVEKAQAETPPKEAQAPSFDTPSPFFDTVQKRHWVSTPDIKPEKGYNPYRDDFSAFKEIYKSAPQNFKGTEPLEGENEFMYHSRRRAEYAYTKHESKRRLSEASNFSALLSLIFVVFGLAIQITAMLLIGPMSASMNEAQYGELINVMNYVLMAIQYLTIFPLIFLVGTVGRKNKCRTFFQKPRVSGAFIFRWCVISLGVTYIVSMLFDSIFSFLQELGMNVNDLSSEVPTGFTNLALYGLFSVICAPIFEEIMFRGIMLTHLQKYGCIFASVVSGIFFGLIHQNHSQMFYAAVLGVIFAIIDIRAGSIIPSIIAHFVVNGYSFLNTIILSKTNYNEIYFGDGSVTELAGPTWSIFLLGLMNVLLYISMIAAIVLLVVEVVKFPQTFKLPAGDCLLTAKEKTGTFLSSPVVIITLILLAATIFMNSFLPLDAISNFIDSAAGSLPAE